jgi:hypothetical protein
VDSAITTVCLYETEEVKTSINKATTKLPLSKKAVVKMALPLIGSFFYD